MSAVADSVDFSQESAKSLKNKLLELKEKLNKKDLEIIALKNEIDELEKCKCDGKIFESAKCDIETSFALQQSEIERYSRQLIIPEVGVNGQLLLKKTSVLIVGAGGLGCPVAAYLAGAGIGKLGIVDYDEVELSNLHRQIFHNESTISLAKCFSLGESVKKLNSSVNLTAYPLVLNSKNIKTIIPFYDIVVDASDNMPTRYLLNDACVLFKKPLVSGSALRFEGHLTVYNFNGGPCYRCLYPVPSLPEAVTNCSDGGIIGAVTGVIGSLQALEVLKIALGLAPSFCNKLLVFDGLNGNFIRAKLRAKKQDCIVCGETPTILDLIDYEVFCKSSVKDKTENINILLSDERVSCKKFKSILESNTPHVLLDVRPCHEFEICHISQAINIPFHELQNENFTQTLTSLLNEKNMPVLNYVICHRGNDSQKAVRILNNYFKNLEIRWFDIEGGLQAWHTDVDPAFPIY